MVIFNSYVKLPEGIYQDLKGRTKATKTATFQSFFRVPEAPIAPETLHCDAESGGVISSNLFNYVLLYQYV